MIVSMHAATGATMGAAIRSRVAASLLGVPLHIAADRVPHRDIRSRRFDIFTGVLVVGAVAARYGVSNAATVGALATCAPDLEHLVRLHRSKKLFHPRGWHRSGRLSTAVQLTMAGLLTARLLLARRDEGQPHTEPKRLQLARQSM
jgi:hypothetical protein